MNRAGDDRYHYSSSTCSDEGYTCSSLTLELSKSDILKDDFENGRQDKFPLAETNPEDGTPHEKELKVDACRAEKGELDVDLEEGEIKDASSVESIEAYSCRYYKKGSCVYGKDCRFFHLSDKGLYNMLDFPSAVTKSAHCVNQFVLDQKYICVPSAFNDQESAWDHALKEAGEHVKECKKKVSLTCEKLSMTIRSGECMNDRLPVTESPLNDRRCQSPVIKVRDSSRGEKVSSYAVMDAKLKSCARDRPWGATYLHGTRNLKISKTAKHMLWSPKSTRSRSNSFCKQLSCSCSVTLSPKPGRRVKSTHVSKSYRKHSTSSSSELSFSSYASKKAPRRTSSRSRGSRSHHKKPITSNHRSPLKISLPRERKSACSRSSRRDIPHRLIRAKHPVTSKLGPLQSKSSNRSYSSMSISPLSDSSNRKYDRPGSRSVVCYSSDRHVSDMSISPFSDDSSFERFSGQGEGIVSKVSKSSVKYLNMDTIQKGSRKVVESTKSCPSENTSREISLFANSTAPIPVARTQTKKSDPLLKDLLKFHGYFKTHDSFKEPKNVQLKIPASTDASKLAVGLTECNGKMKQNPDVNQRDSTFEWFSGKAEGTVPNVSKSNVKIMSVNTVQKRSLKGVESTKSCPSENTSREISLSAISTAPIPAARTQIKKSNPLLKDLMKFHGYFKRGDSCKEPKNVQPKTPASTDSLLAVGLNKCSAIEKLKQNTDVNQSKLSKREILLRRLEEINTAIERKIIFAPRGALKNT